MSIPNLMNVRYSSTWKASLEVRKVKPQVIAMGASAVSAMAAALCCIIAIGAMLLGLGGFAGSALFAKWRPFMLTVSLTLLALAWYFCYRTPRNSCPAHTDCATPSARKLSRATLLSATVMILATAGFPTWSGLVLERLNSTTKAIHGAPSMRSATLRVRIPSMDCAACAVLIQKRIRTQTGILSADVGFQQNSATVRYDPSQITEVKIIATINETGFKVEPTAKENSK